MALHGRIKNNGNKAYDDNSTKRCNIHEQHFFFKNKRNTLLWFIVHEI